jgi:pimeloyl-ACP methyl ester carboxylesterase
MEKSISFKNQKGEVLQGFVNLPRKYDTALIFCHGFPGNAIGEGGKRIGKTFEKLGYLTLRFCFSGTSPSEGRFEDKLMSQESAEIGYAIDFLTENYSFKKLIVVGHSTGAIDLGLYAYRDKRITKVILASPVSDLARAVHYDFSDEDISSFLKDGYITYKVPGTWVDKKRLNRTFYDEFLKLDLPLTLKKIKCPVLITHGERDELVPLKEAQEVYRLLKSHKELVIIKGADHSFSEEKHWKKVVKSIKSFIEAR